MKYLIDHSLKEEYENVGDKHVEVDSSYGSEMEKQV